MRGIRRHIVRAFFATTVIALSVQPAGRAVGLASTADRAKPATRVRPATEPIATVSGDDAEISNDISLNQCGSSCPSADKSKSDFTRFAPPTLKSSLTSQQGAKASAASSIDATVTEFTGAFTQAQVTGTISGTAENNDNGTDSPLSDASSHFDISFSVPGPTQVDATVSFSNLSNTGDPTDCTEGNVDGSFDSTNVSAEVVAGGGCPPPSGTPSFHGVVTEGGDLSVDLDGGVSIPGKGKTFRFSGTFTISITARVLPPPGCGSRPAKTSVVPAQGQCIPLGQILYESNGDIFVMDPGAVSPKEPLDLTSPPSQVAFTFGAPVWRPDGKKVAFVREDVQTGERQIFTMSAGGSDLRQLTTDGNNFQPTWTPDGKVIGFVSDRDGNDEIYAMNANGTHQTRMTTNPATDQLPAWSPDGSTIAFVSDRTGVNGDVFTMEAIPGAVADQLTNDPARDTTPVFAPDGTIFFATDRDGNREIYSMGSDGSNQQDFTNDPGFDTFPTISPDGQFVGFISDRGGSRDIWAIPIGGGDAIQLTQGAGPAAINWGISACTVYGTDGNDKLVGDGFLCGGPGNDTIQGGSGGDILDGGTGTDTITGDLGNDIILGGPGSNEKLQGGDGNDKIGEDGSGIISGGPGDDLIEGGSGKDDILGGPGNDTIFGGDGSDTINGGPGHDHLDGGDGSDTTITDGTGADNSNFQSAGGFFAGAFGGAGNDTFDACNGEPDDIHGQDGHDTATIDQGKDTATSVEVKHFC